MIPVTRFISKKLAGIQRQLMKVKDHRINTTTEALEGMKLIKLQSWEKSFLQRISGIRCDELSVLRKWVSCHRFTVDRSSGTLSPPPCGKPFLFSLPSPPSLPTCSPATSSRAPPPSPPSPCSSCHRLLTPRFNILRFPLTTIPDVLLALSLADDRRHLGVLRLLQAHRAVSVGGGDRQTDEQKPQEEGDFHFQRQLLLEGGGRERVGGEAKSGLFREVQEE